MYIHQYNNLLCATGSLITTIGVPKQISKGSIKYVKIPLNDANWTNEKWIVNEKTKIWTETCISSENVACFLVYGSVSTFLSVIKKRMKRK